MRPELRGIRTGLTFLGSGLENVVAELIERTVRVKAYHVSADSRKRACVNSSTTAIHSPTPSKNLSISAGATATRSRSDACMRRNWVICWALSTRILVDYHRSLLGSLGLPTSWNGGTFDEVLALMHRDKKARGNKLRFVVLDSIGHPVHLDDPPADAVEEAFRRIQRDDAGPVST